jgi:hypothetical protein
LPIIKGHITQYLEQYKDADWNEVAKNLLEIAKGYVDTHDLNKYKNCCSWLYDGS